LLELHQQTEDIVVARKLHKLVESILKKNSVEHLLNEYSKDSIIVLLTRYEININRSNFRWLVERPLMPIEDVMSHLRLAYTFSSYPADGATAIVDLYTFTFLSNYFNYENSKRYHKNPLGPEDLDCGERMLGNI
jgi:hypothetical protein